MENEIDKKAEITRLKYGIKMNEIQIKYLKGEITYEEFDKIFDAFNKKTRQLEMLDDELQELEYELEVGEITDDDFNKRKDKINSQIKKICE